MAYDMFYCPHCGTLLNEHDFLPNGEGDCWKCGLKFTEEQTNLLLSLSSNMDITIDTSEIEETEKELFADF